MKFDPWFNNSENMGLNLRSTPKSQNMDQHLWVKYEYCFFPWEISVGELSCV